MSEETTNQIEENLNQIEESTEQTEENLNKEKYESAEILLAAIKNMGDHWSQINDEITFHRDEIKNLNNKKKELTDTILDKMNKNNIKCIDINDGFLQSITKPTPVGLKKESIQKSINVCINDSTKSKEITEYIFNNKEIIKTPDLKKIKKRVPRK